MTPPTTHSHDHASVLLVDDRAQVQALQTLLRDEGFSSSIATSGEEMADALHAREPDAVILDVALHRFEGLRLFNRVRVRLPTTPIVIVTGWPKNDPRIAAALCLSHTYFLAKPLDIRTLVATVRRLVNDVPRSGPPASVSATLAD